MTRAKYIIVKMTGRKIGVKPIPDATPNMPTPFPRVKGGRYTFDVPVPKATNKRIV